VILYVPIGKMLFCNMIQFSIPSSLKIKTDIFNQVGIYRKLKYEKDLNDMAWKLNFKDLVIGTGARRGNSQVPILCKYFILLSKLILSLCDN